MLLLCCVLGWFVGLPRLHNSFENALGNAIDDTIAQRLDPASDGTIRIPLSDIEQSIEDNNQDSNTRIEGMQISGEGNRIVVRFGSSGQDWGFSGEPTVSNGRLDIVGMEGDNGFLNRLLPPSIFEHGIEQGVNNALDARGLTLDAVDIQNDALILTVSPAS